MCTVPLLAQLYGGMSGLARDFSVSRPTLYAAASTAHTLLEIHFSQGVVQANTLVVDEAQLRRAVVALRVIAPNSIRPSSLIAAKTAGFIADG